MNSTRPKNRFAHLPRVIGRALIAVIPAVLLVTFLVVHFSRHASPNRSPIAQVEFNFALEIPAEVSPAGLSPRPVFPYSVVPGGVRDAQELQRAASSDPVVGKHYSDFHILKARRIQLDRPVAMYVSYRRNNQVFWTRNKMMIPAGEALISDGENLARVRCGNRLSPEAEKPVAATDPDKVELDTPEFIPPMLAELLPGEGFETFPGEPGAGANPPTSNNGSPSSGMLTPFLGPGDSSRTSTIPPPPPVNAAEPGSLSLLFAGAVFFAVLVLTSLRRNS